MKDEGKAKPPFLSSFRLRPSSFAFAALVALYVAARLWRLTDSCLWFDEIFSVHAARHTWGALWRFAAADLIHPPLFYALLKLWTAAGGESLLWLRLFPALTAIAALVPFLLLARELRLGARGAALALLLAAANGYLIKYAQELRMYSLLLLLTLTSLWLFVRLLNSARASRALLSALFFANLLLVYTHYYGWLVVACEAALVAYADRRKLRALLPACAGLLLCFAPWVFACAGASRAGGGLAQNVGWIERPGARDLTQLYALLNEPFYFRQSSAEPVYARGGALLGFLLLGVPVLLLIVNAWRRRRATLSSEEHAREDDTRVGGSGVRVGTLAFLSFFTLAPVALAFAASRVLPYSVWGTRHLIIVAAPYALLCGAALARTRPAWLRYTALLLLSCWLFLVGALTLVRGEGPYVWCAWGDLAASAARDEEAAANDSGGARAAGVNVYAFEELVAYHLWFALEGRRGPLRYNVASLKAVPGVAEDPAYFLPRDFDGATRAPAEAFIGTPRFWLAFRDTNFDETRPPLNFITSRGYRPARVYEASAQGQRAFLVLFEQVDDAGARK
ncbi:MAG TPA: glycosyltransferase family 39 protein [Pyrinomonadaceae bacterium]|nr:glycosyltransferase family 39 protein [Pyrinomonadaceae bacterium]